MTAIYFEESKEEIAMDGKTLCQAMRAFRKEIAEANGIELLTTECYFKGDCPGYCPKCDDEARYLDAELARLANEGVTIKLAHLPYQDFITAVNDFIEVSEENTPLMGDYCVPKTEEEGKDPTDFSEDSFSYATTDDDELF